TSRGTTEIRSGSAAFTWPFPRSSASTRGARAGSGSSSPRADGGAAGLVRVDGDDLRWERDTRHSTEDAAITRIERRDHAVLTPQHIDPLAIGTQAKGLVWAVVRQAVRRERGRVDGE